MREVINNIFDKEITAALDGFPSVYMKDELVCVINRIRLELNELDFMQSMLTEMKFQEFNSAVRDRLENWMHQNDIVDNDSAEFTIGYDNKIELESITSDTDAITEELDDILLDEFQKHFGDLIQNEE